MSLTRDQVKHVAKLANLQLTEEEEEKYSQQLSKILDYVEQLNEVDTSQVKPTFNVSGQENVMAEDKVGECLQWKDGFFVTKGVFNNE